MVSKLYEKYSNFYCVNYYSDSFTALPQQLNEYHTTNRTSPKSYYTLLIKKLTRFTNFSNLFLE